MKKSIINTSLLLLAIVTIFSCSSENNIINTIPKLTTTIPSNISLNTASSGGNITSDGGEAVTLRGIVWNTTTAPTINLTTKTSDGSGIGNFSSSITGLIPSNTYFVRAYATNSIGTAYGNELSFTTGAIVLPTVTTTAITGITTNAAVSGGNVILDGGGIITERGIVWSKTSNPTITLSTKTTNGSGTGAFTSNVTGLSPNTQYYVRAYASNSVGTAYGNEIIFTTLTPNYAAMYPTGTVFCNNIVTEVVDVTNPTTGKTWMDRNLGASQVASSSADAAAYGDLYQWGRRADGHQCRNSATITTISSTDQTGHGNFIIVPDRDQGEKDWRTTVNNNLWQGVNGINNPCPQGYRIPTRNELNSEMLSWNKQNTQAAYQSVLKLTTAGRRDYDTGQVELKPWSSTAYGNYWTTDDYIPHVYDAMRASLHIHNNDVQMYYGYKSDGLSVRCIKN